MRDIRQYINIHTHKKCEDELSIATVGVHPYYAESEVTPAKESIEESIEAIGEIGLDFACSVDKQQQERVFEEQLSLAEELSLPVVIHSVKSFERTLQILSRYNLRAVIFHGFIGSTQQARAAFDRGYYLSFGHRTFTSPKTQEALRSAPLDKIFFETDQCDTSIEEIYRQGSLFRGESPEEIKERLYTNYINIFKR